MIDCVELMEAKNEAKKARKDKKRCEESFRSLRVSLPVNASTSLAFQWGLQFQHFLSG